MHKKRGKVLNSAEKSGVHEEGSEFDGACTKTHDSRVLQPRPVSSPVSTKRVWSILPRNWATDRKKASIVVSPKRHMFNPEHLCASGLLIERKEIGGRACPDADPTRHWTAR